MGLAGKMGGMGGKSGGGRTETAVSASVVDIATQLLRCCIYFVVQVGEIWLSSM